MHISFPLSHFHIVPNLLIWQDQKQYITKNLCFLVLQEFKMIKDRAICRCRVGVEGIS